MVGKIHNRMPVILTEEDEERWLGVDPGDTKKLLACLKPYPSEEMECYPVTPAVNSPKYDGTDCVKAIGL